MRAIIGVLALVLTACGADGGKAKAQDGEAAPMAAAAEPPRNLLTLAEGAALLNSSVNAGGPLALNDGAASTTWNNEVPRHAPPYTFTYELRAPTSLARVGIVGAGLRPGGGAGRSARTVRVEGSSESADAGYTLLGSFEAAQEGETLLEVAPPREVRWLRFTIENNHSTDTRWTYLNEVVAYGEQTPPSDASRFAGIYDFGRGATMELKVSGASVTGCYTENGGFSPGTLSGDVVEGVARITWQASQGDRSSGTALFVIDSSNRLNGVRFIQHSRTVWSGPRAPAGTTTACSAQPAPSNPISDALQTAGEARIYGILFDFDEATIKTSSEAALRQLLAALQASASMNVDIEGHTDDVGEGAYNLSLSGRRAQSVVAWLTQNGIAASRLNAVGRGETTPVASNDTADGRALNRRVEVRAR